METPSLLQSFALNNAGDIVSVDEVERGLACGCRCPSCGSALVAKQGEVRAWHFAHAAGTDCPNGVETALHLAAKQLLQELGGMQLPGLSVTARERLVDGRSGECTLIEPPVWRNFDRVLLETRIDHLRPDIIGEVGSLRTLVEIAVTHYVDDAKRQELKQLDLPAIEIDLGAQARDTWTWEALEAAVIRSLTHKRWLHHPEWASLKARASATARTRAEALPVPSALSKASPVASNTLRFRVQGQLVVLTTLPFGVALWSPYDPSFNQKIKRWAYYLSGQYQPGYRNWLFGKGVKNRLIARIKDAGGVEEV